MAEHTELGSVVGVEGPEQPKMLQFFWDEDDLSNKGWQTIWKMMDSNRETMGF